MRLRRLTTSSRLASLEELKLTLENRGGMTVSDSTGNFVNTILAPWAKDANGKNLPTSYSVSGDVVTQHVDPKGAAFPVVADPRLPLRPADNHGNCLGLSFWGAHPLIGWDPFEYNAGQCR
jgi:hypothetical protein